MDIDQSMIRLVHVVHVVCKKVHLEKLWLLTVKIIFAFRKFKVNNDVAHSKSVLNSHSLDPQKSCLCDGCTDAISVDLQLIIPCYNVKEYIDNCIASVLNQKTRYSYKIVVIDDGSNDGTGDMLDKYDNDDRLQIIHQENRGFSGARNRGLSNIVGKYVAFLDSDDTLEPNAIEELMNVAYRDAADIVEGSYIRLESNKRVDGVTHANQTNVSYDHLYGYPWGKVFNSRMFKNVRFPETYWFEDTLCAYILFPMAKKISTINTPVYCYLSNPMGISAKCRMSDKSVDSHWITEQLLKDAKTLNLINENNVDLYYRQTLYQIERNFKRAMYHGRDVRHAIFVLSCFLLSTYFPNYRTPKNDDTKILEQALRNSDYSKFIAVVI